MLFSWTEEILFPKIFYWISVFQKSLGRQRIELIVLLFIRNMQGKRSKDEMVPLWGHEARSKCSFGYPYYF